MANICHYDVLKNEKYGRYLIANKDLECGELIFTDVPIAVGPKPGKYTSVWLSQIITQWMWKSEYVWI